jgi:hypothetical protein
MKKKVDANMEERPQAVQVRLRRVVAVEPVGSGKLDSDGQKISISRGDAFEHHRKLRPCSRVATLM